jgi:hypothetical protein
MPKFGSPLIFLLIPLKSVLVFHLARFAFEWTGRLAAAVAYGPTRVARLFWYNIPKRGEIYQITLILYIQLPQKYPMAVK